MRGTPQEVAGSLRQRAKALKRGMIDAERETAGHTVDLAHAMSSGGYSQTTLTRMGHPYAKRNPNPPMDPSVINAQSGRFLRAWRVMGPRTQGNRISTDVRNSSPEARFINAPGGTRFMIARPIRSWLIRNTRVGRRVRLLRAIRKALHS